MKVCRYDDGNTTVFTCPYHGWSYGTDGALAGVPFPRGLSFELDKAKYSLRRGRTNYAATRAPYGPTGMSRRRSSTSGRVPAFPGSDARRLVDASGASGTAGRRAEMDHSVQREMANEEISAATPTIISRTARSIWWARVRAGAASTITASSTWPQAPRAVPSRGHQTITALPRDHQPQAAYQNSPEVAGIFAIARGTAAASGYQPAVGAPGEIFQCGSAARQPLAVWHPVNAHQTEVWRFFFVDRDAPRQVKNFLRDYYIRYSGPAGMTEQDDMENWNYTHAASRG